MNVNKVQPFKYRLHFMRRICGRAGVKHFGFHAIRHITASILYHFGYGVAVIQPIISNKSPGTTERYWRSHGLESVREAMEDLSRDKGKVLEFKPHVSNFEVLALPE